MYPLATQEQTPASSPYRADSSQDLSPLVVLGWNEPIQAEDEGEEYNNTSNLVSFMNATLTT